MCRVRFGRARFATARRDRARLHDPELAAVVAPLDVLRRAVVSLDPRQQRAERRELRRRQRRRADRRLPGRARARRQHGAVALADAEIRPDRSAPLTSASPSPRAALTTISSPPVIGLIVNATPEVTAGTMRCTSTRDPRVFVAELTRAPGSARACSDRADAAADAAPPRRADRARRSAASRECRRTSAPALSSPIPDDRTANLVPAGSVSSHGSLVQPLQSSASVASLGMTMPSGTGNPACFSRAQLYALPPIRAQIARRDLVEGRE